MSSSSGPSNLASSASPARLARSASLHPREGARFLFEREFQREDLAQARYRAAIFTPDQRFEYRVEMHLDGAFACEAQGAPAPPELAHNKQFFSAASSQSAKVDWVIEARWVEDAPYATSSGVSAGTDMALAIIARLYGRERAQQIAEYTEYEWQDDPTRDPFAKFLNQGKLEAILQGRTPG